MTTFVAHLNISTVSTLECTGFQSKNILFININEFNPRDAVVLQVLLLFPFVSWSIYPSEAKPQKLFFNFDLIFTLFQTRKKDTEDTVTNSHVPTSRLKQ